MSRAYLAFTEKGMALAHRLARALPGSVSRCGAGGVRLAEWTSTQFAQADALIFVGAAGIAVRAIAPHCKSKATDPAVVVLDECGRFAVPLLSGHLGGANALARALAEACGAIPVITTATDANGVFAVDEWAKAQGCAGAGADQAGQRGAAGRAHRPAGIGLARAGHPARRGGVGWGRRSGGFCPDPHPGKNSPGSAASGTPYRGAGRGLQAGNHS